MFTEKRDRLIFGAFFLFLFILLMVTVIWIVNIRRRNLLLAEKEKLSSVDSQQLSEEVSTYPVPLYTPSPPSSFNFNNQNAVSQIPSTSLPSPSKPKAITKKSHLSKSTKTSPTSKPLLTTPRSISLEIEAKAQSYAEATIVIEAH